MKYFLDIDDLSEKDFFQILNETANQKKISNPILKNKNIGMIFENYSTRTRLSFMVAINEMSGNFYDIKFEDLNLQRSESLEDTFKIFSCYLDALVYRTKNHKNLLLAKEYFGKPVINALSEMAHPCQAISDIYTMLEVFKDLNNLTVSWFGDITNVISSLSKCFKFLPNSKINIFTNKLIYNKKNNLLPKFKNVNVFHKIDERIISSSNCIMTDVYTSMNDKKDISKERSLKKFQINKNLMRLTKKKCIFMHCLPANIGSEVTEDVLNGKQSIILKQAKNKIYAQKAILKWLKI